METVGRELVFRAEVPCQPRSPPPPLFPDRDPAGDAALAREEAASEGEGEGEGFPRVGHRTEGSGSQRVLGLLWTTCQYNPKAYTAPTTQPQS